MSKSGFNAQDIEIGFHKISYDRMLTDNMRIYQEQHPDVDMHVAIDITRGYSDRDYLEAVTSQCKEEQSLQENGPVNEALKKQIVYLDRNNTPDVWGDITKTIKKGYENQSESEKNYKSILIMPEQHPDFDPSRYHTQNPICPQMIYECIKRIFGRKSHDCLSAENKPKVVEVILKFAKLYDGCDLANDEKLLQQFDGFIRLDFLQFKKRPNLDSATIDAIIDAYNQTPPNFQPPSDETIEACIRAVERQIQLD